MNGISIYKKCSVGRGITICINEPRGQYRRSNIDKNIQLIEIYNQTMSLVNVRCNQLHLSHQLVYHRVIDVVGVLESTSEKFQQWFHVIYKFSSIAKWLASGSIIDYILWVYNLWVADGAKFLYLGQGQHRLVGVMVKLECLAAVYKNFSLTSCRLIHAVVDSNNFTRTYFDFLIHAL